MAALWFEPASRTPAEFQRLQESRQLDPKVDDRLQAAKSRRLSNRYNSEQPVQPAKRHSYVASDFYLSSTGNEQIERWFVQFPALGQRNFYVAQNHHATSKHFDLRLQLDGATLSFALPRGLSGYSRPLLKEKTVAHKVAVTRESEHDIRQAIETNPHPINYSLYEGGGVGVTGVWDIGEYKIWPTLGELKRREMAKETCDESHDLGDDDADGEVDLFTSGTNGNRMFEDVLQEDLLSRGFYRASFKETPARYGKSRIPAEPDDGEYRGFVIELKGVRYSGLRLRFGRRSTDFRHTRPKGTPHHSNLTKRVVHWMVQLDSRTGSEGVEEPLGDVSILSGRTMKEIQEDAADPAAIAWKIIAP